MHHGKLSGFYSVLFTCQSINNVFRPCFLNQLKFSLTLARMYRGISIHLNLKKEEKTHYFMNRIVSSGVVAKATADHAGVCGSSFALCIIVSKEQKTRKAL